MVTRESFLKDVATHGFEVLLDNGMHRHIRLRRPGTYCMGFDIVTWPGYLAISGDMGCYTFARLPDMFEFFRSGVREELSINEGYWSEKLQAISRGGFDEFDEERFKEAVLESLDGWELTTADRKELRERLKDEVFCFLYDGEIRARDALSNFQHETVDFQDFWEIRCRRYTHQFLWCCWAIVWTIQKYAAMSGAERRATRPEDADAQETTTAEASAGKGLHETSGAVAGPAEQVP